jgi:hypothetical protein
MNISELQTLVKYISNAQGEKTEVIIPIEIWNSLLQKITPIEPYSTLSGLSPVDENEPKTQILADLQESIRAARAGETYPISQLWSGRYSPHN